MNAVDFLVERRGSTRSSYFTRIDGGCFPLLLRPKWSPTKCKRHAAKAERWRESCICSCTAIDISSCVVRRRVKRFRVPSPTGTCPHTDEHQTHGARGLTPSAAPSSLAF